MARKNTNQNEQASEAKAPDFIAWHVAGDGKKGFWTRIGAAWKHKDGEGFNVQLDLVPIDGGRIVLRAPKAEAATEAQEQGA